MNAVPTPDHSQTTSQGARNATTTVAGVAFLVCDIALLALFVSQPASLERWGQAATMGVGLGLLSIMTFAALFLWRTVRTFYVDLVQAQHRADVLAQVDHEGAQIIAELERRTAEQTQYKELAASLAVPLIRVTDQVIVAPLVGPVDRKRLGLVRANLMQGLEEQRARVVLIDLTGVTEVEQQATDLLIQLLSAIELMGCQIVLTGISKAIAQTLLAQGAFLGVETRRDVMSGLARAAEMMGQAEAIVR